MKSNLIFIGMPAVGKSTVGIVVAKKTWKRFHRFRSSDSGTRRKASA